MTSKFLNYCMQFKTDMVEKANFQFQPGGIDKGWKLDVPVDKITDFWDKYYEYKVKPGDQSHLLERPGKEFNVLKIDLDLKHLASQDDLQNSKPNHKYTQELLKDVIGLYALSAANYIILPDNCTFTIFEKQNAKLKGQEKDSNGYVKDGVHIMCPEIIAPNTVLHAIYDHFIKMPALAVLYEKFKNVEPVDVMFDSKVISTNAWFPVGSGKPEDNKDYYVPTKTYKVTGKKMGNGNGNGDIMLGEVELKLSQREQISYFSNIGKPVNITVKPEINLEQLASVLGNKMGNKKPGNLTAIDRFNLQKLVPSKDLAKQALDLKYIEHLLSCLSTKRCADYDSWFKVGTCLYNISPYLINMFDKWSSMVPEKYNQDSIYRYWYENFTKNSERYSLGLDKLKQYAKADNEALYYRIVNIHKTKFIDGMVGDINSGMHKNKVAHVDLVKKLKEYIELHCEWQVKCADNTSNTWYKFEGHRWHEDKGANKIYQMLTDDILKQLKLRWEFFNEKIESINAEIANITTQNNAMSQPRINAFGGAPVNQSPNPFLNRANIEESLGEQLNQTSNLSLQKQQLQSAMQNTVKLSEYIQTPANRNNIIKDLSQECFDKDFYTNLDTNPNVFVCNNCVLDLEDGKIRPGLPKDMSTLSSGLDFPHDTNSMEAQNIFSEIEEFLDKIFPDQQNQDYTLNLYAESLSGFVRREEFYIHTGSGGNGKSLNADLLSHVFGEYYYAPDSTIFNTPKSDPNAPNPIIANARGKRIVMTTEPKQERGLQADIIKQYSGCDPITGRHLNKEPITFKPSCKWNMQCNDIPELDSTDEGIMRRVCVIPYPSKFVSSDSPKLNNPDKFPNHFPKDPTIKEKLPTWAPYFLAMLWQRYLKLKDSNFMDLSETRRPEAVNEATTNYKKESSIYASFYEDKMEEKLGYRQNLNEMFNHFKNHLRDSESMKKVDRKAFETQMKRFLNIRIENKIKWVYDCVIIGQGEEYNG